MLLQEEWDKITMEEICARIAKIPRRKIPAILVVEPSDEHCGNALCCPFRKMGPTVIDKSQSIGSIGPRLRDNTRTVDSGVRAWSIFRRALLAERYVVARHLGPPPRRTDESPYQRRQPL